MAPRQRAGRLRGQWHLARLARARWSSPPASPARAAAAWAAWNPAVPTKVAGLSASPASRPLLSPASPSTGALRGRGSRPASTPRGRSGAKLAGADPDRSPGNLHRARKGASNVSGTLARASKGASNVSGTLARAACGRHSPPLERCGSVAGGGGGCTGACVQ